MAHLKLFVVRIWHPPAGGFRASVRRIDDNRMRHFVRADELARFLACDSPYERSPEPPTDSQATPKGGASC
jgi:hypothetical protein